MVKYKEKGCGFSNERRIKFPDIEWLDVESFEKKLENGSEVYPNATTSNGDKIYVGKTVPTFNESGEIDEKSNDQLYDLIGYVFKSAKNGWQMCYTYDVDYDTIPGLLVNKQNFVILSIDNEKLFCWKTYFGENLVPKYTFRSVDFKQKRYASVGRTICEGVNRSLLYRKEYSQEAVPSIIGEVNLCNNELCVSVLNENIDRHNEPVVLRQYKRFEVLCLNPSPSALKELCRIQVRKLMAFKNENISTLETKIPEALLNYVKYPTYLYVGESLFQDEKLISQCGNHELCIKNNELQFKSLAHDVCQFSISNVESLDLYQNSIVISFNNKNKTNSTKIDSITVLSTLDFYKEVKYRINYFVKETPYDYIPQSNIEQFMDNSYRQYKVLDFAPWCMEEVYDNVNQYDDLYDDVNREDNEFDQDEDEYDQDDHNEAGLVLTTGRPPPPPPINYRPPYDDEFDDDFGDGDDYYSGDDDEFYFD